MYEWWWGKKIISLKLRIFFKFGNKRKKRNEIWDSLFKEVKIDIGDLSGKKILNFEII